MFAQTISRLYNKQSFTPLQKILGKTLPADMAQILDHFPEDDAAKIFYLIPASATAASVLKEVSVSLQNEILKDGEMQKIIPILEKMAPDARTDLFGHLDAELAQRLLESLNKEAQKDVENLLQYHPDTAGGLMTTQFFALNEATTVQNAIESVRNLPTYEMVFYLSVVAEGGRLSGVSSLRQLLLAKPEYTLAQMMNRRVVKVRTSSPQDEVAEIARRYRLLAVPVVDEQGVLVGLVTVDDVIGVLEQEVTDEVLKHAGTSSSEILATSAFKIFRIRLPWLIAAFVGGLGASLVINSFETTLSKVLALGAFLPIILGMAGNVGNVAATVAVRGLATGAVKLNQLLPLLLKELRVGLLLGGFYGVLLGVIAYVFYRDLALSQTLVATILLNMTMAAMLAASLPLFFQRIGADPAVASGPFVLTAIDLLGVGTYFLVANALYGL
ncbi:MAG: magnesium transporter [Magnetococcales bacterium]|nr:magnesium transporter [Magnetococcales bacterium]